MSTEQQSWNVRVKYSLKASIVPDPGVITVCEDSGLIVFTQNNENKTGNISRWPLEAFLLKRRRPKEPQIHLRFISPSENAAKNSLTVYAKRLRQDVFDDAYETDLIIDFTHGEGMPGLDRFEARLAELRNVWVGRLEEEQRLDHIRTKKKYVDMYVALLDQVALEAKQRREKAQAKELESQTTSRQEALATNPALNMLFRSLVVNLGVLTEEEFWHRHADVIVANLSDKKGADDFYVPTGDDESQKARLPLLLKESLVIRTKYAKYVQEHHMSETEFWSRLYKSHFYCRLISKKISGPPEPLFDDENSKETVVSEEDDVTNLRSLNINRSTAISQVIPTDLNLTGLDAVEDKSFGINNFLKDGGFPAKQIVSDRQHQRQGKYLTLSERLNRHASRVVKDIQDTNAISTSPVSCLGTMAALVALEEAIEKNIAGDLAGRKMDTKKQLFERRRQYLENRIIYEDLCAGDKQEFDQAGILDAQDDDGMREEARVTTSGPPEAILFNRSSFLVKLQKELQKRGDNRGGIEATTPISQNAQEFVAKCCFAKFTRVLRSMGDEEKEYLLQEALTCEAMVEVFHEVADSQTHCRELLYHIYKEVNMKDGQRQKIVSALLELKERIHLLMRIEVDASVKTKLTALVNTRTLCQPILNTIDHAIKTATHRIPSMWIN